MITFDKGVNHGISFSTSPSVRGHLRPIDNDFGAVNELRSGLLHDVGRGLDKSSDIEYIRNVFVPRGDEQGEK